MFLWRKRWGCKLLKGDLGDDEQAWAGFSTVSEPVNKFLGVGNARPVVSHIHSSERGQSHVFIMHLISRMPICTADSAFFSQGHKHPGPTNNLSTGLTDVCIKTLKAGTAVGLATLHDISPCPQGQITLQAAKVLFMPAQAFSLHALQGEDQLKRKSENPDCTSQNSRLKYTLLHVRSIPCILHTSTIHEISYAGVISSHLPASEFVPFSKSYICA